MFPELCAGVEGAFYGSGEKTVIPRKVVGKFSIRIVPDMDPNKVEQVVKTYINELWKKRNSPNNIRSASFFLEICFLPLTWMFQ